MYVTLCDALYDPLFRKCVTQAHEQLELKNYTFLYFWRSFRPQPLLFRQESSVPSGQKVGYSPEPVWNVEKKNIDSVQYSLSIIQIIYRVYLFNFTMLSVCQSVLGPTVGGPLNGGWVGEDLEWIADICPVSDIGVWDWGQPGRFSVTAVTYTAHGR
jgi:hypothetical protein